MAAAGRPWQGRLAAALCALQKLHPVCGHSVCDYEGKARHVYATLLGKANGCACWNSDQVILRISALLLTVSLAPERTEVGWLCIDTQKGRCRPFGFAKARVALEQHRLRSDNAQSNPCEIGTLEYVSDHLIT